MSHLLQMRGLKPRTYLYIRTNPKSHLLQMRGLKLLMSIDLWRKKSVASFTDAWIETSLIM